MSSSLAGSAHRCACRRAHGGPQSRAQPHAQRGAIAVLVALLLTAILGLGALAVDITFAFVVRNELQTAADAAALSGAARLYDDTAAITLPDWDSAAGAARATAALNRSSGIALEDATIVPGYWTLAAGGAGLQSLPATPAAGDAPALMVTLRRVTGENGGPVPTHFARVLGINSLPVVASAVAAVAPPGAVGAGVIFPLAVSACLYRDFWNAAANPPGPKNDPGTGVPYVFRIGPGYTYGSCAPGTWTSFADDDASAATLQALIGSRNSALLQTGVSIWMQLTADDSLYAAAGACSASGSRACESVIVPVVESVTTHGTDSITGFACLRIELASSNGDNYVQAVMSGHCKTPNAGGVGPNYGALATARLVQ